jgi:hypothetical protein
MNFSTFASFCICLIIILCSNVSSVPYVRFFLVHLSICLLHFLSFCPSV